MVTGQATLVVAPPSRVDISPARYLDMKANAWRGRVTEALCLGINLSRLKGLGQCQDLVEQRVPNEHHAGANSEASVSTFRFKGYSARSFHCFMTISGTRFIGALVDSPNQEIQRYVC